MLLVAVINPVLAQCNTIFIHKLLYCIYTFVLYVLVLNFFFFFQAEDGIRDKLVTGVQTCALPISYTSRPLRSSSAVARRAPGSAGHVSCTILAAITRERSSKARSRENAADREGRRSEERRVGKECRSRWSPYH